jgi:hypothetical protein
MQRRIAFAAAVGILVSIAALTPASAPASAQTSEIELFNGVDLSGWDYFLVDEDATIDDVWSVEDGILVCQGEPGGYLYTEDEYESFRLVVEWRWPGEPGNSGVLMRIAGEPMMLPSAIEAQLRSGDAGELYTFHDFRIRGPEDRLSEIRVPGWHLARFDTNENPPGEWNRYEITVDGDRITLALNGKVVNEGHDVDVRPGPIGLQSEGALIHFRTVSLTPLDDR